MKEETEAQGKGRGFPALGPWQAFGISFLLCFSTAGVEVMRRASLRSGTANWMEAVLVFALLFGTLLFVIYAVPLQLIVMLILRRWKPRHWAAAWLMLLPAGGIAVLTLHDASKWGDPSHEKQVFERVVGVPCTDGVKLVLAKHGFGFQDKTHLWLFEGTPEQFARFVNDRGWNLGEEQPIDEMPIWEPAKELIRNFSEKPPWEPEVIYSWMSDDDESPLRGPGWLIADKRHKRWCVWWSGI